MKRLQPSKSRRPHRFQGQSHFHGVQISGCPLCRVWLRSVHNTLRQEETLVTAQVRNPCANLHISQRARIACPIQWPCLCETVMILKVLPCMCLSLWSTVNGYRNAKSLRTKHGNHANKSTFGSNKTLGHYWQSCQYTSSLRLNTENKFVLSYHDCASAVTCHISMLFAWCNPSARLLWKATNNPV